MNSTGILMSQLMIQASCPHWGNASVTTAALYGFIGGLVGLLLFLTIVYILHLIITPYRQRNEARAEAIRQKLEYDKLKRSTEELLKSKEMEGGKGTP